MLATPYVDDLSIFVRVVVDRPNAVARLFMLFEIEQGADSIPVCIVILGRYVLKDELAGRAVVKQVADVAANVAAGRRRMTKLSRLSDGAGVLSANAVRRGMPGAAVSGRLASGDNAASPRPSVNARRLMAWCSVISPPFAGCGYALVLVTILPRCLKTPV